MSKPKPLKTYGKAQPKMNPSDSYWDIVDSENNENNVPKKPIEKLKKSTSTNSLEPKNLTKKRKAAVQNVSENEAISSQPEPIAASTILDDLDNKPKTNLNKMKLFQMSDSSLNSDTNSVKSEQTSSAGQRMSTRSSRSNLKEISNNTEQSVSASATAIVGNSCMESIAEKPPKSILKAKSKNVEEVVLPVAPILKNPMSVEERAMALVSGARPKRNVKILEKIEDKPDQILNVKCDNKTKHTASTSTPSGLRRRPLKAPQDVSMICKPE